MTNKVKCFISYCHEDADRNILDYLKYQLEEELKDEYEILLDTDLAYGSDLNQFMALLDEVTAVIILMTPAYKKKILERSGGVYEEFSRIYLRHQDNAEQLKKGDKKIYELEKYFELIPILFSGTHSSSVPDFIAHIKYSDMTSLFVRKDKSGKFQVPYTSERLFLDDLDRIVSRLRFIANFRNETQKTLYHKYYERLFLELKSDWRNPRDNHHDYSEQLFVTTHSYKKIAEQSVFFLVGRKGIGKSTVTDLLAVRNKNKYEGIAQLIADDFDLEMAYSFFNWDQIRSDLHSVIPRTDGFRFAWEAFIYICCMQMLVDRKRDNNLNNDQIIQARSLEKYLNEITEPNPNLDNKTYYKGYFIFCWNAIIRFINECIDGARSDEAYFYTDIKIKFNRKSFLEFLFGKEVLDNFNLLSKSFRKRFLITLDGFDTVYAEFRRVSINQYSDDNAQQRANFEIDWLRSLLHLVLEIKQFTNQNISFHKDLDFCITVPDDRFYEIYRIDRDAYRYINRYRSLDWSGIELAILLRKRLEELTQFTTEKLKPPAERLGQVLAMKYPNLPKDIIFRYNGHEYSMPLFFYILRHTFWRPREILMHYAQIIAYAENTRSRNQNISTEIIRRLIQEASREIIQTEFINEFQDSVKNMTEIIESFNGEKNILPYSRVAEILGDLRFWFVSENVEPKNVEEKLEFLYRVGFLGVKVTSEMKERHDINNSHSFYFNEGLAVMRRTGNSMYDEYTFIVHPIFTEYLQLNTKNSELVLELNWEYLHDMEDILSGTGFSRM